ncbi:MAG TPA: hypothetical protein VKQ52_15175, partial [Puia sp.]|nr:hypothetical protein [Puia sp.]
MRITLLSTLFFLSFLRLSAQSGGYSNLEFIENKGQWDTLIRFNAAIGTGNLFMQRKGFTVLLHDTNDMKRIGLLLHGDVGAAGVGSPGGGTGKSAASVAGNKSVAAQQRQAVSSAPGNYHYPGNPNGGGSTGSGSGSDPFLLHSHAYRVSFENANDGVQIVPDKALDSYNN